MKATKARSYLKSQVDEAKEDVKTNFLDKGLAVPSVDSSLPPSSQDITIPYSLDFAQQVL